MTDKQFEQIIWRLDNIEAMAATIEEILKTAVGVSDEKWHQIKTSLSEQILNRCLLHQTPAEKPPQ